jgi:hypothetical protein
MPLWLQNLLVLLLVVACLAFVARQAISSLRGKRSKLGSCCAKGCDVADKNLDPLKNPKPQRIVFLPAELLGKRK